MRDDSLRPLFFFSFHLHLDEQLAGNLITAVSVHVAARSVTRSSHQKYSGQKKSWIIFSDFQNTLMLALFYSFTHLDLPSPVEALRLCAQFRKVGLHFHFCKLHKRITRDKPSIYTHWH